MDIHDEAMRFINDVQSATYDDRQQATGDRRFYSIAGAQWEGTLQQQFENKPKFEINKVHLSVIRIFNEYRNNRIDVEFIPKDGRENQSLSDLCNGLYRADEQDSCAEEAYDNAFEEAVGGGMGAFRLRCDYEDEYNEDNEHQRIRIEPIFDADRSVFFDLGAKRQDKSDAKKCVVVFSVNKDEYISSYNDNPDLWDKKSLTEIFKSSLANSDLTSVPQAMTETLYFDWNSPDVVYLADYYVVEDQKIKVSVYQTIDGEEEKYTEEELDDEKVQFLEATGSIKIGERTTKKRRVRKYLLSGGGVLADYGYIAGRNIPIVPVYGKRWFVDNKERFMGQVRLAADAQRLKNMQMSKLAEISALSSIEKPIFDPEQIDQFSVEWSEDNIVNRPYLRAKVLKDMNGGVVTAGPVGYTKVPQIPPAMAALLQITDQDIKEILGSQEASDQIVRNPSGIAVQNIQERLDMQSFIYTSNMGKANKRAGEIWLDMAKEIYIEDGRRMKTVGQQGEIGSIVLNSKPIMDEKTGEIRNENDLSNASFDVSVTVGPSSISRRMSTVRSLTSMMGITQDQQTIKVLTSMAMMNIEGEGIQDVRDYFRKEMVTMGVIKPTEEEAKEMAIAMQTKPPDPNSQYLQAAAEQAQAEAAQARAKTVLTISQAKESDSKIKLNLASAAEKLAGAHLDEAKFNMDKAKTAHEMVMSMNDIV